MVFGPNGQWSQNESLLRCSDKLRLGKKEEKEKATASSTAASVFHNDGDGDGDGEGDDRWQEACNRQWQ